jgi:sugar O-acyltransferase (sialic acid O-acetyltransferase NeuD family)
MLIIGAKGFAKEVLEVLYQNDPNVNISFYDDVTANMTDNLYEKYPVIRSEEEAHQYFVSVDERFVIGVGNPFIRQKLKERMEALGGKLNSVISPFARIGNFGNKIGEGVCIMTGTVVTNDVHIGNGVLINLNCTIGHDSRIGEFVELSPGVHVSGNCTISDFVTVGTNATILPGITIGENSIVAAGSVVTKNVDPYTMVAGVPAIIKKKLEI